MGNVDSNWRCFTQQSELYMTAIGLDLKPDKVIEKFQAHCSPQRNTIYERYMFRSRMQQPGETFDCFVTDLKRKVQSCDFGDLKDSMIRDQIVYGIYDK